MVLRGIGSNVLAARLRELQDYGIIDKRTLPPPTPVTVYELTEAGRALGPTVASLRKWGTQHAPPAQSGDAIRPAWVLMSAASGASRVTPHRVCELRVDAEVFQLLSEEGGIAVRGGPAQRPDAAIAFDAETLYKLVVGRTTAEAVGRKWAFEGDRDFALELLTALSGTVITPSASVGRQVIRATR
jgi:hypothetical protein